ncbi:ABC transporter permease [Sanguibacter suaedae]|nr:ABC transporter permease [Sanguibacter suaedae]
MSGDGLPWQQVEVVHLQGLHPVGRRPGLREYVAQLWARRHFVVADSRARVASGTRQMILGNAWLVLKPVLDGLVYFAIFGLILKSGRGIDNFVGYLLIGVFMFQFTARCLSVGASSVSGGRTLIRSFLFPRAALPVAAVLRETLSMVPVVVSMLVLVVVVPPHAEVTWRWLLFPGVFTLQLVFNAGIALLAARLVARVRDLSNLIGFFTRFWLYGSGVFFSFDSFVSDPTVLAVVKLNPMYVVLDMTRDVLLYGRTPEAGSWVVLASWALGALLLGFVFFWRGEETYGRE